jgi:hypothetical protein
MTALTLSELKRRIQEPLDLEEETFIESDELTDIINTAIDEAEAIIHNIYEDYFLTSEYLTVEADEDDYDLPTDIYANKIRSVVYNDGLNKYEIKRYNGPLADIELIDENEDYRYMLVNGGTTGYQIRFLPAIRDASTAFIKVWYLRNAATLDEESDVTDIPEFVNFIISKAQGLCLAKENGGIIPAPKQAEIEQEKQLMINTLSDRVPDGQTEILPNFEHYIAHC